MASSVSGVGPGGLLRFASCVSGPGPRPCRTGWLVRAADCEEKLLVPRRVGSAAYFLCPRACACARPSSLRRMPVYAYGCWPARLPARRLAASAGFALPRAGEKQRNQVGVFAARKTNQRNKKTAPFYEPKAGDNERSTNRSTQFVVPVLGARKRTRFRGQGATRF